VGVLAVAGALLAGAGCGDSGAWAMRYAEHTVSHAALADELAEIASNEQFLPFVFEGQTPHGDANGSYTQEYVGAVIENRVFFDLISDEVDTRGLAVTDRERESAASFFEGVDPTTGIQLSPDVVLGGFSDDYRDQVEEDLARLVALQGSFTSQEEFGAWLASAYEAANIRVSSRYGHWDGVSNQVIAPDGPRPAPTEPGDGFDEAPTEPTEPTQPPDATEPTDPAG
jgi:hypothetical protein